jgi:hypothetical protein
MSACTRLPRAGGLSSQFGAEENCVTVWTHISPDLRRLSQQRADLTAFADHKRHFAGRLATGASLRKTQSQQTGDPVDA